MNLNDPFNRLCKQQHNEYLTFRDALKNAQVDSLPSAEALLADIKKRAWKYNAIVALTVLVISVLFPEAAIISMIFGVLISLWLITNSFKGQRYVKRYMQEEISKE